MSRMDLRISRTVGRAAAENCSSAHDVCISSLERRNG
jgi:hypothetical protein